VQAIEFVKFAVLPQALSYLSRIGLGRFRCRASYPGILNDTKMCQATMLMVGEVGPLIADNLSSSGIRRTEAAQDWHRGDPAEDLPHRFQAAGRDRMDADGDK
jgi:hypothetical protein